MHRYSIQNVVSNVGQCCWHTAGITHANMTKQLEGALQHFSRSGHTNLIHCIMNFFYSVKCKRRYWTKQALSLSRQHHKHMLCCHTWRFLTFSIPYFFFLWLECTDGLVGELVRRDFQTGRAQEDTIHAHIKRRKRISFKAALVFPSLYVCLYCVLLSAASPKKKKKQ